MRKHISFAVAATTLGLAVALGPFVLLLTLVE
jgi:hypothetical protein